MDNNIIITDTVNKGKFDHCEGNFDQLMLGNLDPLLDVHLKRWSVIKLIVASSYLSEGHGHSWLKWLWLCRCAVQILFVSYWYNSWSSADEMMVPAISSTSP